MLIYNIILAVLLLLAAWMSVSKNKYTKLLVGVSGFLLLSYFAMHRYAIGYDYGPYAKMFQQYSYFSFAQLYTATTEKGYALLNHYIGFFSLHYKWLFAVTSILSMAGVCFYLYRKSEHIGLSLVLFLCLGFYYNAYNFIRQFMAAVVLLQGYRYLIKRDFMKYVLYVLLASTFHMSALIMLPFYWLLHIPVKHRSVFIYFMITILIYLNSQSIFSYITTYIYKSYNPITSIEMTKGIPITYMLPFLIAFVLAYPIQKQLVSENKENVYYINSLAFILCFQLIGTKHAIVSRFILLFMIPAICIIMPNCIRWYYTKLCEIASKYVHVADSEHIFLAYLKRNVLGLAFVFTILLGCILNHQYLLARNYNGVVPYQTYPVEEGVE